MTTPTRRISFYLKPVAVNSEREACNYLDSLPASERSRAQRAAFLAGLALIKRDPAFAYWLAEWPELRQPRIIFRVNMPAHLPPEAITALAR